MLKCKSCGKDLTKAAALIGDEDAKDIHRQAHYSHWLQGIVDYIRGEAERLEEESKAPAIRPFQMGQAKAYRDAIEKLTTPEEVVEFEED